MDFSKSFFESEVREGFYVPSIMKRCWASQIKILEEVQKICEKHNITYYLNWGTLLGAIRHGGYIPWDDDLDISMLREDYQRFFEVWKKEKVEHLKLLNCFEDDYYQLILRPCVDSTLPLSDDVYDEFYGFPYLSGIDIFPLDYVAPESERHTQIELLDYNLNLAYGYDELNRDDRKDAVKHLEKLTKIKIDPKKNVHRQVFAIFDRVCSMYKKEECEYVTQITHWIRFRHKKNALIHKSAFGEGQFSTFEGLKVHIPSDYDEVLSMEYGNYMKKVRGGAGHGYPYYVEQEEEVENAGVCVVPKLEYKESLLVRAKYFETNTPVLSPKQAKRIVIVSHRPDRWNAIKSIYDAAAQSENCEILVYAIPYFVRQRDGRLTDMEYHPELYPSDVSVIDYQQARLEDLDADVIIYQTPYDDYDINNSIHPSYYSADLQKCAPEIIYVPDFMTYDFEGENDYPAYYNMRFYVTVPGVIKADHIVVQSEKAKENYIKKLVEFAGEDTRAIWEDKIIVLGSPMMDDANLDDPENIYPNKPAVCGDRTVGQTILDWILSMEKEESGICLEKKTVDVSPYEMDDHKFAFIICSNDEIQLNEALAWVEQLHVPDGYDVDVLTINDAESMLSGMTEGKESTNAKYKIYMHQDVCIINRNFLSDILTIFQSDNKIGLIGMVGTPHMAKNGVMKDAKRVGDIYHKGCENDYANYRFYITDGLYDVDAIEGFMMITQYDVPFRMELFKGWDFYDVSTSYEYRNAGYRVVVPKQNMVWCVHDDGVIHSMWNYEENREIAVREYLDANYDFNDDFGIKISAKAEHKDVILEKADLLKQLFQKYLNHPTEEMEDLLCKYFVKEQGYSIFDNDVACVWLKDILEIVQNEREKHQQSFVEGLTTVEQVLLKYQMTIMALRRIELGENDDFIFEGVNLLIDQKVSPSAVEKMLDYDYIADEDKIWTVMCQVWDEISREE